MRTSICLVIAIALIVSAAGCARTGPAAGTLTIAEGLEPTTLNPLVGIGDTQPVRNIAHLITETLMYWDWDDKAAKPLLAESWQFDDETTFRINLRTDVSFTNGEPMNATAVKFSLEQLWADDKFLVITNSWEEIVIEDSHTVIIRTSRPDPILELGLAAKGNIVPPEYYAARGKDEFGIAPVGTGPYTLKEWLKGDRVVLTANDDYWGDKPKIAEVVFKSIPEEATRLAALENNEVDIIGQVPIQLGQRIDDASSLELVTVPGNRMMSVRLNRIGGKPLSDPRVAQALNYAVDKQKLIDDILMGYGKPLQGQPVSADYFGFNPELPAYPYDPDRARELMAAAGYPDGFDIDFEGPAGRYPYDRELAEAITAQLGLVGVNARLTTMEVGAFFGRILDGQVADIYYLGDATMPDGQFALDVFRTGTGFSRYANAEYDRLVVEAAGIVDHDRRLAVLHQAMETANVDPMMIYLFTIDEFYGANERVQGWRALPGGEIDIRGASIR